ncbi:MAG: serine hydrolase domain-containing protein [Bacteroidota bacterium]
MNKVKKMIHQSTLVTTRSLWLCLLFAGCGPNDIEAYLSSKHEKGKLNGNVLVVRKDTTIYERSFGFADAEGTERLTSGHRFNVGSIYKEFPAVAIMQLQEKGQLHIGDRISRYLTNLPNWSEKVTVKHLLQYSSGLPQVPWQAFFQSDQPVIDEMLMGHLRSIEKLEFEPGTDYLYTNFSPILLMKIVEAVTKLTFTNYAETYLWQAPGMDNTIFCSQYPYQNEIRMAIPFDNKGEVDDYNMKVPALLMAFTAHDLFKWLQQLHAFRIISKPSLQLLSQRAGDQSPLGICDWQNDLVLRHHHHGSSGNYEAVVQYYAKKEIAIIILTNRKAGNVSEMANDIMSMLE